MHLNCSVRSPVAAVSMPLVLVFETIRRWLNAEAIDAYSQARRGRILAHEPLISTPMGGLITWKVPLERGR